jgi:hypothetical protein
MTMMISPEGYIEMLEDKSYSGLLKKRDSLIRDIRKFENDRNRLSDEYYIHPSPEVCYQMNLQYLGKLCELILAVYNREYVWGDEVEADSIYRDLLDNIEKLHTTELGMRRIKENLSLDADDIVKWCKDKIRQSSASIAKQGKNWYVKVDEYEVTVNATSFTIITAHRKI